MDTTKAYCDWNMERVTIPKLHEFDGIESTVIVVGLDTYINDRTLESSKLFYSIICGQLEKEIQPSNNSVTQDLMVISVVIWTRIKYIYAVMYEVDTVYAIVVLLHNRQKELYMTKIIIRQRTVCSNSGGGHD